MRLRLKTFEKAIHTKLRTLESFEWKKLRPGWSRQYQLPHWLLRSGFVAIAAFALYNGVSSTDSLVALITLLATGTIFWRAAQLLIALYSSSRLQVFAYLPLSNAQVFKLQWQMFLRNSSWSLIEFTAIYGVLAEKAGCGWNSLLAGLAMSVAQCMVVVALATSLVAYFPRRRFDLLAWSIILPGIGLLFGRSYFQSVWKWLAEVAHYIPPTGWILYALGISRSQGFPGDLWPSLTTGLVLALLPKAYQHLRSRYALPEVGLLSKKAQAKINAREQAESFDDSTRHNAITARIRTRGFLSGLHWKQLGWLERSVSNWLTGDERLTAEFLCAGKPAWTKGLINFILIFAGAAILIFVFPRLASLSPLLSFYLLAYAAHSLFIKVWPGVALRQIGGNVVPLYSIYPIGFWQIVRVMMKANTIRMLVLAPVLLIAAYVIGTKTGHNFSLQDLKLGLKVACAVLCLQPVFAIMSLISGTNGSRSPIVLLLILLIIAVLVGCGFALFLAQNLLIAIVPAAVLFASSMGTLWLYGYAYNHNWFDLQSKPKDRLKTASA